ncbi:receptor-like serine/threonine-protein kinase ALE2 isoform X1 [Dendrobium catenatum]|uniref:receptor-like serine/threonine-protein kinase ALE2 isoform X1 n=2 Tax=Dendrobium catenatum TaxID=906689 RepID=UPI0009F22DE7|nr:receptor-like serine/threonine-protein kinase ALE2 isoform X1 [Dendrobium catenatum]
MERRESDLVRCVLRCLVFYLGICGIAGLGASPPDISLYPYNQMISSAPPYSERSRGIYAPSPLIVPIGPVGNASVTPSSRSEAVSPIIQEIVPSVQLTPSPLTAVSPQIPHLTGSVPNPPSMLPPNPMASAPNFHAAAPFITSSPPAPAKEHKSPGSVSPPQGSQAPNIFHNPGHDLSPSSVNPPSTQVRSGTPISETPGKPSNGSPTTLPHAAAPSPTIVPLSPPDLLPNVPRIAPSMIHPPGAKGSNGPTISPAASPSTGKSSHLSPTNNSQFNGSTPIISPSPHDSNFTHAPSSHLHPPEGRITKSPQPAPAMSVPGHKGGKRGGTPESAPFSLPPSPSASLHPPSTSNHLAPTPKDKSNPTLRPVVSPAPLHQFPPFPRNKGRATPPIYIGGPVISPALVNHPPTDVPKNGRKHNASPPNVEGPEVNPGPSQPPIPSWNNMRPFAPSPHVEGPIVNHAPFHPPIEIPERPYFPPDHAPISYPNGPIYHPTPSPRYFRGKSPSQLPQPIRSLPPPPPNLNCGPITCQEPLANPLPGAPCTCVQPIKVGLRLGVALYTFFPLVSEFAQEIASGIFVKQSQVRIMGANAASEDTEKAVVLIDLVPLGKEFDYTTAFLTYEKFWHKQVAIQASYFGDYEVLYVLYPGLPPSPPTAPAYINVEGGAYGNANNARGIRPLGVDVRKQNGKRKPRGSLITVIVLSSVISLVLIVGAAWFLFLRHREHSDLPAPSSQSLQTPFAKLSAGRAVPVTTGSRPNSTSASFSSNLATYTGSAKTFSLVEIEKATNKFDDSRIVGEGGFGRVYKGVLEDGTRVAVKVLKRDDQQGEREFLAEVEMLGRLHHRNLVKLIGICTEENTRCLVYELIPNGSVESHLHGVDKDIAPLDWNARMKIALGAARGLAYLHEDSSPRVIHRDFKSSNILLEHDYTPKVSDFGLARAALDEQNEHISTRVMGTFGYVAPEYAMTGHLLVKSDVYSYGVVLIELLTGRKPVDMLQPPGQENLVSWARPLLTKVDGLDKIIDPTLGTNYPQDSIAKVAAIASMCVEPEVSYRPFMGEVVQALKLVCNESDEFRHSESCSNEGSSAVDTDTRINIGLCQGPERGISQSDLFYPSAGYGEGASGLFQINSSSGPLRTGRSRHFFQRIRELASRSASEHRFVHRFRSRSEHREGWP